MTLPEMYLPAMEVDPIPGAIMLALADDEFVLGHRHSEWLGLSPFLEEDLAMASIAQDELGHARALYGVLWPSWPERDAMLPLRAPDQWRCCALVEFDARPWERHLIRHVMYDVIERHRWTALSKSDVAVVVSVADRALSEERWHERHAVDLLTRLAPHALHRLQPHADDLWPLVGALMDSLTEQQRTTAVADVAGVLNDAGLAVPGLASRNEAIDRRQRSEAFGDVHASLTEVSALDPSATW